MRKYLVPGFLAIVAMMSCKSEVSNSEKLKDGKWHAEFIVKDNHIPFVFDVKQGTSDTAAEITLINGTERVPLSGITYRGDSIIIPVKDYDTELKGVIRGDTLSGIFKRLFSDSDPGVPFQAIHGNMPRFARNGIPGNSMEGRWNIRFITDQDTENNVGIFDQKEEMLTGSILTNSGDLRYLEGVVDQDGFKLSAFAGLSPYLLKGKFTDKDHFEGEFITSRQVQQIKGARNEKAELDDPYGLTHLNNGARTLGFKLPDIDGNMVSLSDRKFRNKVVVVSVLGSWCPNCLDEMAYLAPWYKKNKDRGVEIVGLAFERKDDPEYVHQVLTHMINKYGTTYDILFAGKLGDAPKVLPEIDQLKSYPTTLFIDKKGVVRKIHTGFNGPATGLFYNEFKTDFNSQVDQLLAE